MLGNIVSDLMRSQSDLVPPGPTRSNQGRPDVKSLARHLRHPDTLDQSLIPQTVTPARCPDALNHWIT